MFLVSNDFYENSDMLFQSINDLDFIDGDNCLVLPDFPMVSDNHKESLSSILNFKVALHEDKCLFKKYNEGIFADNYDENTILMAMIVFEDMDVSFWKHTETNTKSYLQLESVENLSFNSDDFTMVNSVKLSKNDLIIMNPYQYRSISSSALVQTLYFGIDNA